MPPLRQAFDAGGGFDAGGNHFSFATPTARKSHGPDGEGGTEYGTSIQKVKGSYGYFSRPSDLKLGAWTRGNTGNRRDLSMLKDEELKGLTTGSPEDEHLGADASPLLRGKARPLRLVPIFPSSQAQAMARYRQEMMELVRGVPESAYELSLRDLVEVPRMGMPREEEDAGKERGGAAPDQVLTGRDKKTRKKVRSGKKQILRSTSMDSGVFLLKMFLPTSLGWRRRSASAGSGSKVSPKPVPAEGEKGRPEKEVDAQWLEGCGEMSRSGSGQIKNSGQRRKTIGCYPFSINKGRIR